MASSAQSAKLYGMFDAYPGQTEFIGGDVTVEDGGSNTITMKADLKSKRFFLFFVCLFIILPSPFFLFFNGFSGTFHVFGCPIAITNHTPAYVNPPLLSQPIPRLAHTSSPSLSLSHLSHFNIATYTRRCHCWPSSKIADVIPTLTTEGWNIKPGGRGEKWGELAGYVSVELYDDDIKLFYDLKGNTSGGFLFIIL